MLKEGHWRAKINSNQPLLYINQYKETSKFEEMGDTKRRTVKTACSGNYIKRGIRELKQAFPGWQGVRESLFTAIKETPMLKKIKTAVTKRRVRRSAATVNVFFVSAWRRGQRWRSEYFKVLTKLHEWSKAGEFVHKFRPSWRRT